MVHIKRILCPVDLSPPSGRALDYALALARWYEARITVLHTFEMIAAPGGPSEYPGPILAQPSRAELTAAVERFAGRLRNVGVPFDLVVEEGNAARTIVATAARLPADLIVMGTHGRGGFEHLLLGSVAEKVLRRAWCPVLVVPPAAAPAAAPVRFDRILCPVDFAPSSVQALEYAVSLAQQSDAPLTVLHVIEPLQEEAVAVPFDVQEFHRLRVGQARERLSAAIPADARERLRPVETLTVGKPYREILRVAREINADLIVMGVAGRGAVDLMLFGSTTNHVVRAAVCPVLTLRASPADGADADRSRQD